MDVSNATISLGPGGAEVAPLGIGTWAWGDRIFWGYGGDYGVNQVEQAFRASLAAGVTFFDTAEVYGLGESERLLRQFIQQNQTPVQIATKYFPLPWRFGSQAVEEALSASLDRLGVKRVDLYQVHQPFNFFMSTETLFEALAREVKRGRIGAVGVSNYSAEQMTEAHRLLAGYGIPLAVNQMRYSLITREIERNGVFAAARKLGVVILAYSPLAQGLLTGKYTPEKASQLSGARQLDPRFSREGLQKLAPVLETLTRIARTHDRTPAQVALNWLIAQGGVIPIPGAKNADQARQNAGALGWQLSAEEVAELSEISLPRQV
ncbi:MAG: aldo/keto reductase [Gemmatimonadaceae bacterium]|nr:aldo/keto reductase [Gloeobacterales cyanobacterium ES-bin-141]